MKQSTFTVEDLFDGYVISSEQAGPNYLILVCVHGNETCGLDAILSLRDSGELFELVNQGSLTILLANKEAYLLNERIINRDLNRSIGMSNISYPYEKERANLVASCIANADFVLDIHSTSSPSPSHTIPCENIASERLAQSLCTSYMVSKLVHLTIEGGTTMDFAKAEGCCAVTVECGQHQDESTVLTAKSCIRKFLQGHADQCKIQLECKGSIEVKEGFKFERKFSGFDFVEYNQKVAQDNTGSIVCPFLEGAYIVMPNLNPELGEEAFYWAVKLPCVS